VIDRRLDELEIMRGAGEDGPSVDGPHHVPASAEGGGDTYSDQPLSAVSAAASADPEPPQSASPKLFEATHGTVAACLVLVAVLLASLLTIRRKPNSSKKVDPEPSRSPPSPGPETDGTRLRSQTVPVRASPASPDPPQRSTSAPVPGGISSGPQKGGSFKWARYKRRAERIIESLVTVKRLVLFGIIVLALMVAVRVTLNFVAHSGNAVLRVNSTESPSSNSTESPSSETWLLEQLRTWAELLWMLGLASIPVIISKFTAISSWYHRLLDRQVFSQHGFVDSVSVSLCTVGYKPNQPVPLPELKMRTIMTVPLKQMFQNPEAVRRLINSREEVKDIPDTNEHLVTAHFLSGVITRKVKSTDGTQTETDEIDAVNTHWGNIADPFVRIIDERDEAAKQAKLFRDQIVASISSPFAEGFLAADMYPDDFEEEEYAWGLTYEADKENVSRKMRILLVRIKSLQAMRSASPTDAIGLLASIDYFKRRWRNLWLLNLLMLGESPSLKLEKKGGAVPLKLLDVAHAKALLVGRGLYLPVRRAIRQSQ
jgi:hypothetical protein